MMLLFQLEKHKLSLIFLPFARNSHPQINPKEEILQPFDKKIFYIQYIDLQSLSILNRIWSLSYITSAANGSDQISSRKNQPQHYNY